MKKYVVLFSLNGGLVVSEKDEDMACERVRKQLQNYVSVIEKQFGKELDIEIYEIDESDE